MKDIIINADDFGLCESINRGIIYAYENGIVNSVSILAVGEAFESAIQMAREHPELKVGMHLCLTEEKPVLLKEKIKSLTENTPEFICLSKFILKFVLGRINMQEVENELNAQVQKVINAGIMPSHIDSHRHIHFLPSILEITIKIASKYNIKRIRLPLESFKWGMGKNKILLLLTYLFNKSLIAKNSAKFTHKLYGLAYSGNLDRKKLLKFLKVLKGEQVEILCHPGAIGSDTKKYSYWHYKWENEVKALCNIEIKNIFKNKEIFILKN